MSSPRILVLLLQIAMAAAAAIVLTLAGPDAQAADGSESTCGAAGHLPESVTGCASRHCREPA